MSSFNRMGGVSGFLPSVVTSAAERPKAPDLRKPVEAMQPPKRKKADTLLGSLGGFAAPAINKLFR